MSYRYIGLVLPLGIAMAGTANAEWRCDCTTIVDSCQAQVSVASDRVDVTTDHQQCARVDYFIDGMPFVSVVVDGQQRQDWISPTSNPNVLVQSCQVCLDHAGNTPAPTASSSEPAELEPLIEIPPAYPPAAQARGLEGYVDISFTVDAQGLVVEASVTGSDPAGVFDQAALAAVQRWRFRADLARQPQTLSRRLDFRLDDYIFQLSPAPAQSPAPQARPLAARNQCVREQAIYNYGEIVEVGLMNVCDDPLLVFGCSQGASQYAGRWVCVDSERQQRLLAAPADTRIGELMPVPTPDGQRSYEVTANFFMSRAPNTHYWWLACHPADSTCRDNARLWMRSVDRQLTSVNPQSRTSTAISRSY